MAVAAAKTPETRARAALVVRLKRATTREDVGNALLALEEATALVLQADDVLARELRARAAGAAAMAQRQHATTLQRHASALRVRAEVRLGELNPPVDARAAAARRGDASTRPGDASARAARAARSARTARERADLAKCRRAFAASPYLSVYLRDCEERDQIPTRNGLVRFAAREGGRAAARSTAADITTEDAGGRVFFGELTPTHDPAGGERGPCEVAADEALRLARQLRAASDRLQAAPLEGVPDVFARLRLVAVKRYRQVAAVLDNEAGRVAQLGRDERESAGGSR